MYTRTYFASHAAAFRAARLTPALLAVLIATAAAGRAYGHPGCGGASSASRSGSGGSGGVTDVFGFGGSAGESAKALPEPYMGQKVCPVSGAALGSRGEPVPVETSIRAEQPSLLGRLLGRKPKGVVVYVCCPACAEQVRRDPVTYFIRAVTKGGPTPPGFVPGPATAPPTSGGPAIPPP